MTAHDAAVVFCGGEAPARHVVDAIPPGALVVAADSGADHALALGVRVDVVVGDLDSVSPAALAAAEAAGARVERYPVDKDATDLELAFDAARRAGATRVVLVGGAGGRLDHHLAGLLLLASPAFADLAIEAWTGDARVVALHGGSTAHLRGAVGSVVTILAVGGDAHGVCTEGLRYPLRGEALHPGSTRGVSNVMAAPDATVALASGSLLIIQIIEEGT